eukprot:3627305-Amphidinium_carterae.1
MESRSGFYSDNMMGAENVTGSLKDTATLARLGNEEQYDACSVPEADLEDINMQINMTIMSMDMARSSALQCVCHNQCGCTTQAASIIGRLRTQEEAEFRKSVLDDTQVVFGFLMCVAHVCMENSQHTSCKRTHTHTYTYTHTHTHALTHTMVLELANLRGHRTFGAGNCCFVQLLQEQRSAAYNIVSHCALLDLSVLLCLVLSCTGLALDLTQKKVSLHQSEDPSYTVDQVRRECAFHAYSAVVCVLLKDILYGLLLEDKAPDMIWDDANYGGRKSETSGVVAILSMIKEDLEKDTVWSATVRAISTSPPTCVAGANMLVRGNPNIACRGG